MAFAFVAQSFAPFIVAFLECGGPLRGLRLACRGRRSRSSTPLCRSCPSLRGVISRTARFLVFRARECGSAASEPLRLVLRSRWVKRRREVPCKIRNCHRIKIRPRHPGCWQRHARAQLKRRNRRCQTIIRCRVRAAAHRAHRHAASRVDAIHLHDVPTPAARHRALLRRAPVSARHQRQWHRQ